MARKSKEQTRLRNRDTLLQVGPADVVVDKLIEGDVELLKTLRSFNCDGYKVKLTPITLAPARLDTLKPMHPLTYDQAWKARSVYDKISGKMLTPTNDTTENVDTVNEKRQTQGSTPNRLRQDTPDTYLGEYVQVELAYGSIDSGLRDHLAMGKSTSQAINTLRKLDENTSNLLAEDIFVSGTHSLVKTDVQVLTPLLLNDKARKDDWINAPSTVLGRAQTYESLEPDTLVTNAITLVEAEQEQKVNINIIRTSEIIKEKDKS